MAKIKFLNIYGIKNEQRLLTMAILISICFFSGYFFLKVLSVGTFYINIFYIPIVLGSIWWGYRGLVVSIILSIYLVILHIFYPIGNLWLLLSFRLPFFVLVSILVSGATEDQRKRLYVSKKYLEDSEKTLKVIFSAAPVGINLFKNRTWIWTNKGMQDITGYTIDEMIGKSPRFLYETEEEYERVGKVLYNSPRQMDIAEVETRLNKKNGDIREVYIRNRPLDEDDFSKGYITIVIDTTERKKLEDEIKLLYNAIEQAPAIVAITDKFGSIKYVNPKFTEVTGYSSSEVIGKNPRILKSGFLREEQYETLWKTITSGESWRGEFQNRKKDGTFYWEASSIAPVKNTMGEITNFVKVSEDITYKKLAEKMLQEKEETLKGILSSAPIGINLVQNRIMKWSNFAMIEITGYPENELVGNNTRFLYVSEEDYEIFGKIVQEKKNEVTKYETQWITKDNRLIDVLILTRAINPYDVSKGFITIVSDITKAKMSQRQLDENLEYFAHLVDQIRNPLAIISGFTQVEIESERMKERLLKQVDRIEELIKQLDQGWMDTEETRRFLKK